MRVNTDDKKKKRKLILSGAALVISALLLAISYAWFCTQREMTTAAWIKAPIVLDIRAGNDKEIKYLDMGDIEVGEGKNGSKDYVFCVYGKPVDNYSLQLAYTTNIAFHYDVYRADLKADGSGKVTFESPDNRATFNIVGNPVISGLSMNEIKANKESPAKYQSHALSYGDEKKENIVAGTKVQANNEPLYFLAEENGIKVMRPRNIIDGKEFLDYYVIRVSWKAGEVHEDKETDIVYLTASR
mgnify:FL=1